jgi:tetratricopeptide (TPR) repeat protein
VALPKKAKHRNEPVSAAVALDEIESFGDRVAQWLDENQMKVIIAGIAILVVGGVFGFVRSSQEDSRIEASEQLASVERNYRSAMGAGPSDLVVREPANPETAQRVRAEYVARFKTVADAHEGDAAGSLASLEMGVLQHELGKSEEALETWAAASARLDSNDPLKALLSLRIAAVYEDQDRWIDAAQAFETAAAVESFPLRYGALADAARCFAEAGEIDRALEAFARVETEAPAYFLPEHVGVQLRELKAARRLN